MQVIQPRRVELNSVGEWMRESIRLIGRRPLGFLGAMVAFFLASYAALRAVLSLADVASGMWLLAIFLPFCSVVLVYALAEFVMISHHSDHSERASASGDAHALLRYQKPFVRFALLAFLIGATLWVVGIGVDPARNFAHDCQVLADRMVFEQDAPAAILAQLGAGMLYFLLLAMFSLRTFFSIPLMIFHDVEYGVAQALSQKAIIINMMPMSVALFSWAGLFLIAMLKAPFFAVILLPVFGAFVYVCYRHVFLGVAESQTAKALPAKAGAEVGA